MSPLESRAKEIFLDALDVPGAERPGFVEAACGGDAELRARVEALLGRRASTQDVLGDLPAAAPWAGDVPTTVRELGEGDRVGPFVLGRFLGEGGFGLVFAATQERPVHRTVALKLVKVGMDSKQVLARFETERQALAIMDHPNIATVLDAGATESGRPYFVMEYVDGIPITRYADEHELGTEARLRLFRTVCQAIQHAHQKGVIHRDVKPSNVLVGTVDGQPVPKVIDFGIAKATERRLTDDSFVTHEGLMVGTPAYMSPEQALGAADIDTRSDVYSLGVLLYELLAGAPPFVGEGGDGDDDPAAPSPFELVRQIVESDPPPPSARRRRTRRARTAAGSAAAGETTSTVSISGELDWIVLRCLEKDPARRYATANALAADVGRYLDHEPVEAAPPTPWYRVRKLVRRHRAATAAAAALVAVLVLGAVGTSLGMLAARRSAAAAERERANVLRLSTFARLEDLVEEADELWPATLELEERFVDWLRRADEVVASLEPHGDAPGHRAQLAALTARAQPVAPDEVEAALAAHPRHAEWRAVATQLAALALASDVRAGRVPPPAADPAALDPETAAGSVQELNERAWTRVEPGRSTFGQEAEGLALARLALERAGDDAPWEALDTLAWAELAVGRVDAARAAMAVAVDAAPELARESAVVSERDLERAIASAEGPTGAERLARLRRQEQRLAREVQQARPWRFEREEDRWWHGQLRKLVAAIEEFAEPETGLVDGVAPGHGWGVARRLEHARTLAERSLEDPEARRLWAQAIAAIADPARTPAYGGLSIAPQLGLLPLGPDPRSGLWEFAHLASGAVPARGDDGALRIDGDTCAVLVLVPGGRFLMGAQPHDPGAPNHDPEAQTDEGPVHEVELGPYLLSKYELTQGQWETLTGANPSRYDPSMAFGAQQIVRRNPVEQVSWDAAVRELGRFGLTLPSEAQWEYAARAGTRSPWSSGDERESLVGVANLADRSAGRAGGRFSAIAEWPELDDGFAAHAPVGSLAANPWGFHDVHGNVWEWCLDGYWTRFYDQSEGPDPVAPAGTARMCVNRGGGFATGARSARSSNRDPLKSDTIMGAVGVRPARALDGSP